jgi:NAD-dependent dihydropyrimidine dehydrogenase PreA subunit
VAPAKAKTIDLHWLETNFPCMQACPVHTQAGRYVALIAEGRYEEAYRYAREPNPLASICGRVCGHPCETNCRRGKLDAPISIRALKRFLTERFGPESRNPIDVHKDGRKAAEQIDRFLRGPEWKPKPTYVQVTVLDHHEMVANYDEYTRLAVPSIPLDRRTGISEVEIGFTEEQARAEASRCLKCWINTIFEGNEIEGTECILCGGCVDVCPENCLSLVPLSQFVMSTSDAERAGALSQSDPALLQHLSPEELTAGEGSVMVKDETICIRCGLCAERCPAHTITMEAFEVFDVELSDSGEMVSSR